MRSSIIVAVSLLLLAACQSQAPRPPPSMSVAEAKTITAGFPNTGFVPPPRAITDITTILDQQKPDETYRAAAGQAAGDTSGRRKRRGSFRILWGAGGYGDAGRPRHPGRRRRTQERAPGAGDHRNREPRSSIGASHGRQEERGRNGPGSSRGGIQTLAC